VALRALKSPPAKKKPQDQKQDKKDQPKPQDQGQKPKSDEGQPPPPKTRPQDQLSKEDAERLLRAVAEKEKAVQKQLGQKPPQPPKAETEEDW
jgi:Ca-activated chloride channel family protein